jgi:hypothetical protein
VILVGETGNSVSQLSGSQMVASVCTRCEMGVCDSATSHLVQALVPGELRASLQEL